MLPENTEPDQVIATIAASPGRRILGIGSLYILSLMVIYVAIVRPPDIGWQVFLFVLGGGSIWIAEQMRRATAVRLELTMEALRDSDGDILTRVEDIVAIDRGMFAFKPSNGFLLRLSRPGPRTWRPGLWWRMGSRIGVGGMTPGHQAKFMAEMISAMIAQRTGD
ncbi:hypothetical protein [uncultured Tateyamaria sp.]|uniref:hypothetical protein n=1 Tax=uncultured Tateyamaria sp. TaxID=455651 RepID=UPI00260A52C0|nr:hypothetical protein [uncultured Tateyamaria sp.]